MNERMTLDPYELPLLADGEFLQAWQQFTADDRAEVPERLRAACEERFSKLKNPGRESAAEFAAYMARTDPLMENAVSEDEPQWPEPVDVFRATAAPSMPLEALPDVISTWAVAHSCASGFDAGSYAFCALVAASSLIDHRARLTIADGFSVPAFLWGALVDASGGGKSPILDAALSPVVAINDELVKASRQEAERFERDNSGKKTADRGDPPAWRQILTNNATVEGLATLLADNPAGVLLHSDELTEWLGRMDAYNASSGKDRAAFLTAFNGGSIVVNRAKGNQYVPAFSMSVLGGIQPVRVAELLAKAGAGDGLLQRLLPYCPAAPDDVAYAPIDRSITTAYRNTLARIYRWTADGRFLTGGARLSNQAREQHREYHNTVRRLAKLLPAGRFAEHLHKLPGLAGRLAFTLHAIEVAADRSDFRLAVEADTHARALRIMATLYRHAEATYAIVDQGREKSHTLAKAAAETILARTWHRFTWSDLTRYAAGWQAEDAAVREVAIDRLIEFDWIADVTPAREPGRRGRSAAGVFDVNPAVHDRFAMQADAIRMARLKRHEFLRSLAGGRG